MKTKYILPLLLVIDILILLYEATTLSISYDEARLYFGQYEFISYLSHFSTTLFGNNDIALRLVMILFHIGSVILFYKLTFWYLKQERERLILTGIFILLPGVISAALLLNNAGLVLFATLLFIYMYKKKVSELILFFVLLGFAFLDNSFLYFFLSLLIYNILYKKWEATFFLFALSLINLYLFGTDIGGYPSGHFLDALGIYAAIFSPILFIYIVYALYRTYLTQDTDIVWFVATIPLIFSLLLSIRQLVHIEYYAPFVIPALLIAGKIFTQSYHVRLQQFRKKYRLLFQSTVIFLFINFIVVLFNTQLYFMIKNPKRHFAYKHHVAKELANQLQKQGIKCIHTDYKMQLRLKFYGLAECHERILTSHVIENGKKVTISYNGVVLYQGYVTKLNIK